MVVKSNTFEIKSNKKLEPTKELLPSFPGASEACYSLRTTVVWVGGKNGEKMNSIQVSKEIVTYKYVALNGCRW